MAINPVPRPRTSSLANLRGGGKPYTPPKAKTSKLTPDPCQNKNQTRALPALYTRQSHALDYAFHASFLSNSTLAELSGDFAY